VYPIGCGTRGPLRQSSATGATSLGASAPDAVTVSLFWWSNQAGRTQLTARAHRGYAPFGLQSAKLELENCETGTSNLQNWNCKAGTSICKTGTCDEAHTSWLPVGLGFGSCVEAFRQRQTDRQPTPPPGAMNATARTAPMAATDMQTDRQSDRQTTPPPGAMNGDGTYGTDGCSGAGGCCWPGGPPPSIGSAAPGAAAVSWKALHSTRGLRSALADGWLTIGTNL
jgi:hypothetical protein